MPLGKPLLAVGVAALLPVLAAPASASAAVYDVPASIPADCSVPVETQLTSWIASVPDGSTVRLGAGKCYGQDESVTVTDRANLTIDGNGSELRALTPGGPYRANLRLVHGSNLAVLNLTVRGSNQAHKVWNGGGYESEWQHGFSVEGVYGLTLDHVRATEVWGDGILLFGRHGYCVPDASTDVAIRSASTSYTGRNGVSFVDVERAQLTDSSVTNNLGLAPVDIEPDDPCWYVRDVLISRNTFDVAKNQAIKYFGQGQVSNVRVTSDNVFAKGRRW